MDIRDWLVVAGILIVCVVVFDGFRRARRARRDAEEMERSMRSAGGSARAGALNLPADYDPLSAELPNGGYRVVARGEEPHLAAQTDSPEAGGEADQPFAAQRDPGLADADYEPDSLSAVDKSSQPFEELPELHAPSESAPASSSPRSGPEPVLEPSLRERLKRTIHSFEAGRQQKAAATVAKATVSEEWIAINVVSAEDGFDGAKIQQLTHSCGFVRNRHGVFERHEIDTGKGPVQFSMANALEPGFFDENLEGKVIRGICLYLRLPGPENPLEALEAMLATAQVIQSNFGGEIRDENHSVMTEQTREHARQRVREFERRRRLATGV